MNCEPRDLAVRLRVTWGGNVIRVGAIVRVVRFVGECTHIETGEFGQAIWEVEYSGEMRGPSGYCLGVPDCDLRPIHNPGDDAQDESLTWLPVPSREGVAA
jgi:hypothetical protein